MVLLVSSDRGQRSIRWVAPSACFNQTCTLLILFLAHTWICHKTRNGCSTFGCLLMLHAGYVVRWANTYRNSIHCTSSSQRLAPLSPSEYWPWCAFIVFVPWVWFFGSGQNVWRNCNVAFITSVVDGRKATKCGQCRDYERKLI
jgi:hypothetical protein